LQQKKDVLILCAGWKNKFNLEDSLFAGALANQLRESNDFYTLCDSTIAAGYLYERAEQDLYGFLEVSSHRHRLKNLELEADVKYCLQIDIFTCIPIFNNDGLVELQSLKSFESVNSSQ